MPVVGFDMGGTSTDVRCCIFDCAALSFFIYFTQSGAFVGLSL